MIYASIQFFMMEERTVGKKLHGDLKYPIDRRLIKSIYDNNHVSVTSFAISEATSLPSLLIKHKVIRI